MEANNMKAMREALEIAKKAICNHARANHTCNSLAWENSTINENCGDILCAHRDLCEAKTAIQKALAEPRRNCEVGTPEEQAERFHDFCIGNSSGINGMCNPTCPCIDSGDKCHCLCNWAQMPYKADEKGESDDTNG